MYFCVSDTSRFLIGDSESEAKWKFSLRKTLAVASGDPLLSGRKFLVTPSVQPGGEEFVQIVKGAGGEVVQRWRGSTDVIVISAEADRGLWGKFHQAELPVYSVELLLTGILQHKLELGQNKLE